METPLGDLFVRAPVGKWGRPPALRSKRAFRTQGTDINPIPPTKMPQGKSNFRSPFPYNPPPAISFQYTHAPPPLFPLSVPDQSNVPLGTFNPHKEAQVQR